MPSKSVDLALGPSGSRQALPPKQAAHSPWTPPLCLRPSQPLPGGRPLPLTQVVRGLSPQLQSKAPRPGDSCCPHVDVWSPRPCDPEPHAWWPSTASVPSGHPEPMLGSGQGWASILGEPQATDMLCFGSVQEWPLTYVLSLKPGSGLRLKCRPPHAAAGSVSLCPRAVQAAAGLGRSAHGGRPGMGRTVLWAPEAEGQG